MESSPLGIRYGYMVKDLARYAKAPDKIDDENVFQEANKDTRKLVSKMLDENLLPGSHIEGKEHLLAFLGLLKEGKKGLILCEHYSNMDLPAFCYLLEKDLGEEGKDFSERIVAIAGMKLNEANPMVKAWAEAFTRVVIYPSRSLAAITDPEERAKEEVKSRNINMASMRAMDNCKRAGRPILVFPSGTRYRPGKPQTRQGVREIDSYLRLFDVMILVSVNGNCLRINDVEPENMLADLVHPDTVIMTASPVIECKQFRNQAIAELPEDMEDKKPGVVQKIMDMLLSQHEANQILYRETYKKTTGEEPDYYA